MTESRRTEFGAGLLVALVALLPFGAAPEVPLLLMAIIAGAAMLRGRIDWRAPAVRLALVLFFGYWLPQLLAAPDSFAPRKSWIEVGADLRFLPLLLFAAHVLAAPRAIRIANAALALLLALWCIDALLQAASGWSLGGPAQGDRLSGIFGDDNLKLGGVIAVLAPFGLIEAWRRAGWRGALPAFALVLTVVLLAGARAAWISLALVVACVLWQRLGPRRGALALGAALVVALLAGVVAEALSPRFAARVDRTATALTGDRAALDHALAGRLPIWDTALAMSAAHPINGVGVRAFRHAYPTYAAPGDPWVDADRGTGALHAHQLLLELASETGLLGLLCWSIAAFAGWQAWRRAARAVRERAAAPAIALLAMLFPFNTHYAVYSSFWSLLLMAMLALFVAALHAHREDA